MGWTTFIENWLFTHNPEYDKGYDDGYKQAKRDVTEAIKKLEAYTDSTFTEEIKSKK